MDIDWEDLYKHCGKHPEGTVFESAWWASRCLNYLKMKEIENMSTPQDTLYAIHSHIRELHQIFEPVDEEDIGILERLLEIELNVKEIKDAQCRHEDLMNIIIKLLSKDNGNIPTRP